MSAPAKPKARRPKLERLEARVSSSQKRLFVKAASCRGVSLTDFMISALDAEAKRVVREHEMLTFTEEDKRVFVDALINPPKPIDRLAAAAERYDQASQD